jgi:hypothetical protein
LALAGTEKLIFANNTNIPAIAKSNPILNTDLIESESNSLIHDAALKRIINTVQNTGTATIPFLTKRNSTVLLIISSKS